MEWYFYYIGIRLMKTIYVINRMLYVNRRKYKYNVEIESCDLVDKEVWIISLAPQ